MRALHSAGLKMYLQSRSKASLARGPIRTPEFLLLRRRLLSARPWSIVPCIGIWHRGVVRRAWRASMTDELLTIKEVAVLLKLADKTVYSMAQRGELPAFKVRGQWRIRRVELDGWIDARPRGRGEGRDGEE